MDQATTTSLLRHGRQLANLTKRCVLYERHEVVTPDGQVVERHQRGEPFVPRKGLGRVPVDPRHPLLDDGSAVAQTTLGWTDAEGRWHRVTRHHRLPGPGPELGRRLRAAGERAIRETLRIATRLAPDVGTGPVFEEGHSASD